MKALDRCHELLRASGSTFAAAFWLLPMEQRRGMTALYAFCRLIDDLADEGRDPDAARAGLARWRRRLDQRWDLHPGRLTSWDESHAGASPRAGGREPDAHRDDDLVAEALAWCCRRFAVPPAALGWILDGVQQDVEGAPMATFTDLHAYCYRVASAVGLATVAITDRLDGPAMRYAELSGLAVQLTNILRDIGEDAGRGRFYLPLDEAARFGVAPADILAPREADPRRPLAGRSTPALRLLLRFQAARAREYYAQAEAVAGALGPGRLCFARALVRTYERLLERLVAADLPVVGLESELESAAGGERRVSLSWLDKAAVLVGATGGRLTAPLRRGRHVPSRATTAAPQAEAPWAPSLAPSRQGAAP